MDRKLKSHRHSNLDKAVIALFSSACAAFLGIALVCLIDWWEWKDAGPAYETSLITNILGTTFIVGLYMVLVAIAAITIYSILLKKLTPKGADSKDESISLLQGAAKEHEKEIIELMATVIKPLPEKETINQAKSAKFLAALSQLGLLDANLDGKHVMAWIEEVTGYKTGETRVFNQALKAVKVNDPDVPKYKAQLEQIIGR